MRFLPVGLETDNKKFLIIGGGFMALPIVKMLLDTEALIYLIGEEIIEDIKQLAKNSERLKLKEETVTEDFAFLGYDFLFIATHNFELNNALELRARNRHMLYERLDILSYSSMSLGKVVEKGSLSIGIHSSKTNPALTTMLEKDIQNLLDQKYPIEKINILNDIRHELVRKNASHIDDIITTLFQEEVINIHTFKEGLLSRNVSDIVTGETLLADIKNGNFRSFPEDSSSSKEEKKDLEQNLENRKMFHEKTHAFPRNYSFEKENTSNGVEQKPEPSILDEQWDDSSSSEKENSELISSQTHKTDQFLDGEGLMRSTYEKKDSGKKHEAKSDTSHMGVKSEDKVQTPPTLHNLTDQNSKNLHCNCHVKSENSCEEIKTPNANSTSSAFHKDKEEFPPVLEVEKKQNSTKRFELKSLREHFFPSRKKEKNSSLSDRKDNGTEKKNHSLRKVVNNFSKDQNHTTESENFAAHILNEKKADLTTDDQARWEAMIHRSDAENSKRKEQFSTKQEAELSPADFSKNSKETGEMPKESVPNTDETAYLSASLKSDQVQENSNVTTASTESNNLEENILKKEAEQPKKKTYKPMTYDEIIKN